MNDKVVDDIVAVLPPLMHAIEGLAFVARHFHPPDFAAVLDAVGTPDDTLNQVRARLNDWPASLAHVQSPLVRACDAALAGFEGLRSAHDSADGMSAVRRALRQGPCAQEALYPLSALFPPVSQFFLDPAMRENAEFLARLDQPARDGETGVMHIDNDTGNRGGFSLYVPEYYSADREWPLVFALHGGGGNGRAFLWNWLRDARSHGAILVAPTATGPTWALAGDDTDTPNLERILGIIESKWRIDPRHKLMTGMSDGGTFCYVSGLLIDSPFTHLAPVSASFHPMLAEMADEDRLRGLPIHLVHGKQDWMFPIEIARHAERSLVLAGANLTYQEINDLSHCYPREINPDILSWLGSTPPGNCRER